VCHAGEARPGSVVALSSWGCRGDQS
jgi:hypothetical protein